MKTGDIWSVKIKDKTIPFLILEDLGLKVDAVPLSSRLSEALFTHVILDEVCGLLVKSIVMCEAHSKIDKKNIINKICECPEEKMEIILKKVKMCKSIHPDVKEEDLITAEEASRREDARVYALENRKLNILDSKFNCTFKNDSSTVPTITSRVGHLESISKRGTRIKVLVTEYQFKGFEAKADLSEMILHLSNGKRIDGMLLREKILHIYRKLYDCETGNFITTDGRIDKKYTIINCFDYLVEDAIQRKLYQYVNVKGNEIIVGDYEFNARVLNIADFFYECLNLVEIER